ncbi:MAG: DUF998 domain-containing protein [Candidatus Lokiarchaeota archaeon]|nr:DUF998 domain-containing protein [Candidatus Lokiarchaeota archaeon]
MKKKFSFFNKLNNLFPGSVFGLISFGISLFTHLIGVLLYPNYNMTKIAISFLGDGYGGIIYRIGLILTGIIGIPFCLFLGRSFNKEDTIEPLRKLTVIGSIIYCVSLMLIGYFWGSDAVVSFIHGLSAFLCWVDGLIFISLVSILMFKDVRYPKSIAFFGFIVAGTFLLHLTFLTPITQWIMTLSIMLWVWIISSYMLYKHF